MKRFIIFLVCIFSLPSMFIVKAQTSEEIQQLFSFLENQKYISLVNKVCTMRQKEYYKNAFMDYCLAYGYCQLNKPQLSAEWFDHMLQSYNALSSAKRTELKSLKSKCQNPASVRASAGDMMAYLQNMNPEGYEGNQAGIESKMGIPSLTDTVAEIDFEHAVFDSENRQFNQNEKLEASHYFTNLLNNTTLKFDTSQHLLIFYSKNIPDIKNQLKILENYYEYYVNTYNLSRSKRLITIFYCSGRDELNSISNKIHHIKVPKATYGYASSNDLVMLGIASNVWLGAMKHELFHLVVRSYIGDIPAWLDEGIACFYESSSLNKNKMSLNFINYRTTLLKMLNIMRYEVKDSLKLDKVSQLTNYNWLQFSGSPGELMIKSSIRYSISYAFVKYLNDKNKLTLVVEAFKNRTYQEMQPSDENNDSLTIIHVRTSDEILTNALGMNLEQIQKDFESWCKNNMGLNPFEKN